eukprot:scaffold888_cov569-Prasinococcus_capsulatus_cf.AAC.12
MCAPSWPHAVRAASSKRSCSRCASRALCSLSNSPSPTASSRPRPGRASPPMVSGTACRARAAGPGHAATSLPGARAAPRAALGQSSPKRGCERQALGCEQQSTWQRSRGGLRPWASVSCDGKRDVRNLHESRMPVFVAAAEPECLARAEAN